MSKKKQIPIIDVVICVPHSRKVSFSPWCLEWTNVIFELAKKKLSVRIVPYENCNIYYARSGCLGGDNRLPADQPLFGGQFDYKKILWIDTDNPPVAKNILKLLDWDLDIVSGIYKMRNNSQFATVVNMDKDFYDKNGVYEFLSVQTVSSIYSAQKIKKEKNPKNLIIKVDYTGMGCMVVKKGVFEKIKYPWFKPKFFTALGGVQDFMSEDVSFCCDAREQGFDVWVDLGCIFGHEKEVVL